MGREGGGGTNVSQRLEEEMESTPSMNVLQCASATCFCHRFALLSCFNLIGWAGWKLVEPGVGHAGRIVVTLHLHHMDRKRFTSRASSNTISILTFIKWFTADRNDHVMQMQQKASLLSNNQP